LKFDKGIDVFLSTDVPPNSGLGASSSLTTNFVNVISKLQKKKKNIEKIAETAYHIGHDVLKWGVGKQDEYASAYGGFNLFKFTKNKVKVERVKLSESSKREFERNSLLLHLGGRGHSQEILKKQIFAINRRNPQTINALYEAKRSALEMRDALRNNDLNQFAESMRIGWEAKKKFTKGITNNRIENISKIIFDNGGKSLKVTGAGGGGHMYVYAEPNMQKKILKKLQKHQVYKVEYKMEESGMKIFDINSF